MKDPRELRKFILDKVMLADLLAADGIRLPQRIKPQQLSCPFHGKDLSMSARFYPETNSMYCFACKEAWDPISYVMKSDGIKFMPAANFLVSHYKLDVSRLRDLAFGDHTKFKGGAARKSKLTDDEKRKKAFIKLNCQLITRLARQNGNCVLLLVTTLHSLLQWVLTLMAAGGPQYQQKT